MESGLCGKIPHIVVFLLLLLSSHDDNLATKKALKYELLFISHCALCCQIFQEPFDITIRKKVTKRY